MELRWIATVKSIVYSRDDHQQDHPAVLKNNDNWSARNPVRGATWLALVSLAWLQLTLASHQFDHVAEYFADTCHVCVQLDRTDDTAADTQAVPLPVLAAQVGPATIASSDVDTPFASAYRSRAPPLL